MLRRRDFMQQAAVGVASVGLRGWPAWAGPKQVTLQPKLTGHKADWTFVGSKDWSEDARGVLYSPVWTQSITRKKGDDLLKREDFAYPSSEVLAGTDLSVEFETFYWSVVNAGVVFRAQDSGRFYLVEFDDSERSSKYAVRLYVQDASGYRREIAAGFAEHPKLPERWAEGPKPDEWQQATPGWIQARVVAERDHLRVFVNGQMVIEAHDGTHPAGRAGMVARGPIKFRNFKVAGTSGKLAEAWTDVGEHPAYFYVWPDPEKQFGDNQTYPGICRLANGDLGVWMGVTGDPHQPENILLVWSRDEGKTWVDPMLFKKRADVGKPGYFFGHKNGHLSCMYATTYDWSGKSHGPRVASSRDGGKTWTDPEPLVVSGKPLYEYGQGGTIGPYSPIIQYSDGTLLQYCYHVQIPPGDNVVTATRVVRRDRSLVIRSTDDGGSWTGPYYLDSENFDSNETMGVERKDGSLIAFSRTLRAPFMWKSTSPDKGITWTKQVQSDFMGQCPFFVRHSSGVLVMGTRGNGVFMRTSTDDGKTWSRETRISLCGGMMGMTQMKDGRVLVVFHEGYRRPTRIRGHYLHVHEDGTLTPA